ncbi:MAG: prepilin-type N-terminal cleavage/methylation domain-containing protein [Burkholderiales bacterium]|nr:prepilin-type N-terminal cleavage/methylation domain-containing protein [Burkholderiales bacterium]MCW5604762.1 prepilin-type N-terminal cleavage/methylation domain-containing protein [Burkholderiales bacterium]
MRQRQRGFSFLELAVAMFILTLLLGSILVPLATQVEQRQISETQRTMDQAKDALLGHAIAFGYLPCADTDNDGLEDVTGSLCTGLSGGIAQGNLPWRTLGLAASDNWGNRFRYAVHGDYARRTSLFTLGTNTSNLRVCEAAGCASDLTSTAVAVLISHGKNGYGATNSIAGAVNAAPAGADELENTDNDRDFVSRVATATGAAAGEFDDILIWLPRYILFNRMVAAGKLP